MDKPLTEKQQRIFDKIPNGWQSETDIWIHIDEVQVKTQLVRMAEKGFLDCKLEMNELYYKKVDE